MTKPGTKLAYENTKIAKMLRDRIDRMTPMRSQREIAAQIGYDKPNVLSMYKRGEAKVPLDRLPDFALALNIDLAVMFRAGLEQWWPTANKALERMFHERVVSENERAILAYIKEVADDEDPGLTDKLRGAIREAFLAKPVETVKA